MSIQRVPSAPFAQIANEALRDKRLSFKARGILAMVLSHSGEWNATAKWLESQSEHDGRAAIQAALNELTELGYRSVFREQVNGDIRTVVVWRHSPELPISRPTENLTIRKPDHQKTGGSIEHNPSEHNSSEHNQVQAAEPPSESVIELVEDEAPTETTNQRINRLTKTYTDRVPLSKFPAVMGIVGKAVKTGLYDDDQITEALARLADNGRPVTVDVLRIELEGLTPFTRETNRQQWLRLADERIKELREIEQGQLAIENPWKGLTGGSV